MGFSNNIFSGFASNPVLIGTYAVRAPVLDSFLEAVEPRAWVKEVGKLSEVYVSGQAKISEFELEELDDRIYNSLVRKTTCKK